MRRTGVGALKPCGEGVGCIFFFSSRRRHTRCLSDWSSDVCSSDLYAAPANVVECWVHSVTGKRLDKLTVQQSPNAVREKFLATNLPLLESPADYETTGIRNQPAVRLGNEYRDWLASGDNWLGDHAVLTAAQGSLRVLFPLPGTILYLDPDLPQQGRRIRLRADGPDDL